MSRKEGKSRGCSPVLVLLQTVLRGYNYKCSHSSGSWDKFISSFIVVDQQLWSKLGTLVIQAAWPVFKNRGPIRLSRQIGIDIVIIYSACCWPYQVYSPFPPIPFCDTHQQWREDIFLFHSELQEFKWEMNIWEVPAGRIRISIQT